MTKRKPVNRDSLGRRTDRVKQHELNQMRRLQAEVLTYAEIAKVLGRKPQTVKRHLASKVTEVEQGQYAEIQPKPQFDGVLQKAQEDHLSEVRNLIEHMKESCITPPIDTHTVVLYPNANSLTEELEANPLFYSLKEHLPSKKLWGNYSAWIGVTSKYLTYLRVLKQEIEAEIRSWQNVLDTTVCAANPIFARIGDKALGKEFKGHECETYVTYADITHTALDDFGTFRVDNQDVAKVGDPESSQPSCRKQYCLLSDRILNSSTTTAVLSLFNELGTLQVSIQRSLLTTLLRRDYVVHSCRLCPGHAQRRLA